MSKSKQLTLRPLPGMPVIRDLVVDMVLFFQQYAKIKPYLINNNPAPTIGVFRCRGIQNCTWVYPKGLNPMAAIGKIKLLLMKNLT